MNFQAHCVLSIVAACGGVFAASAASVPVYDDLVQVESRRLDEVHLRPEADLGRYRSILLDPVQVQVRDDWLKSMNYQSRHPARRLGEDDARRIADETADSLRDILAEAFHVRGYRIVAAPEAGVLRLSAKVVDLYVNAPDRLSPWGTKTFTRDAGQATLLLEVRDAASGRLLGRILHRGKAEQTSRFALATNVSNRFWFDALFGRWAANCVAEFETDRSRQGRSTDPAAGR